MVWDVHCGILGSGRGRLHNGEFCAGVHWGGDGFQVLKPVSMDDQFDIGVLGEGNGACLSVLSYLDAQMPVKLPQIHDLDKPFDTVF